jgi:hypothetical protein
MKKLLPLLHVWLAEPMAKKLKGSTKRSRSFSAPLERLRSGLGCSTKKWITNWVDDVKTAEARGRRAEQIAERLLSTMEAERELPPIIRQAFARNPLAREGWDQMSSTRRRAELLAIFYYRTPEARARRLAKAMDEAAALAEKQLSSRARRHEH